MTPTSKPDQRLRTQLGIHEAFYFGLATNGVLVHAGHNDSHVTDELLGPAATVVQDLHDARTSERLLACRVHPRTTCLDVENLVLQVGQRAKIEYVIVLPALPRWIAAK